MSSRTGPVGRKPVIGATMWRRPLPTYLAEQTDLYTLGAEYVSALTEAGALPVLLTEADEQDAMELVGMIDGLLISGGQDVWPGLYGGPESDSQTYDAGRDRSEIALVRAALESGIPVLGICRGLQIATVAFGGSLIEDLPVTTEHPADRSGRGVDEHRHAVMLDPASRIGRALGRQLWVNSIHHQGVKELPAGFRAVGSAADNVVEAVESDGEEWGFVGVQWHPEKLSRPDERGQRSRLFAEFVAAARKDGATFSA